VTVLAGDDAQRGRGVAGAWGEGGVMPCRGDVPFHRGRTGRPARAGGLRRGSSRRRKDPPPGPRRAGMAKVVDTQRGRRPSPAPAAPASFLSYHHRRRERPRRGRTNGSSPPGKYVGRVGGEVCDLDPVVDRVQRRGEVDDERERALAPTESLVEAGLDGGVAGRVRIRRGSRDLESRRHSRGCHRRRLSKVLARIIFPGTSVRECSASSAR